MLVLSDSGRGECVPVGICLAAKGAQVTLTDLKMTLPLLQYNVDSNFGNGVAAGQPCTVIAGETEVACTKPWVEVLDWSSPRRPVHSFDVIVASDVVYDRYRLFVCSTDSTFA